MIKKLLVLVALIGMFSINNMGTTFASYDNEVPEEELVKAQTYYKKGVSFVRARAYDEAINAFEQAISYHPKMTDAYYNIASILVSQKKFDEAYEVYTKLIALNPKDYDAILQAAKISYNRKNYALAIKYLKCIPTDYEKYGYVYKMLNDAQEMFDKQKNQLERSKVSTADKNKTVLIDKFVSPAGIVVDSENNMYVASYSENAIVKFDSNKQKNYFVKDYLLEGPVGLAIDKYDNIYVANYDANNILKITKGGNVSVFMDKVSQPYILYIRNDVLYISEQGSDAVRTYNLRN